MILLWNWRPKIWRKLVFGYFLYHSCINRIYSFMESGIDFLLAKFFVIWKQTLWSVVNWLYSLLFSVYWKVDQRTVFCWTLNIYWETRWDLFHMHNPIFSNKSSNLCLPLKWYANFNVDQWMKRMIALRVISLIYIVIL